jgi:hypothetical protein
MAKRGIIKGYAAKTGAESLKKFTEKGALQQTGAKALEIAGITGINEAISVGLGQATGAGPGGRITADAYRRALSQAGMHLTLDESEELAVAFQGTVGDFMDALPQAVARGLIDTGFEMSGGAMMRIPPLGKVAAMQSWVFNKWKAKFPNATVTELMTKIAKAGGWNGPVQEVLEEYGGEATAAALPGMDEDWGDFMRLVQEETLPMLAAFTVPAAGGMAMQAVGSSMGQSVEPNIPPLEGQEEGQPAGAPESAQEATAPETGTESGEEAKAQETPAEKPESTVTEDERTTALADLERVNKLEPGALKFVDEADLSEQERRLVEMERADRGMEMLIFEAPEDADLTLTAGHVSREGQPGFGVVDRRAAGGLLETMEHEGWHEIAARAEEVARETEAKIKEFMPQEWEDFRAGYQETVRDALGELAAVDLDEETAASLSEYLTPLRMIARHEKGRAFLEHIQKTDPTLWQKIVNVVRNIVAWTKDEKLRTFHQRRLDAALGGELGATSARGAISSALAIQDAINATVGREAAPAQQESLTSEQVTPTKPAPAATVAYQTPAEIADAEAREALTVARRHLEESEAAYSALEKELDAAPAGKRLEIGKRLFDAGTTLAQWSDEVHDIEARLAGTEVVPAEESAPAAQETKFAAAPRKSITLTVGSPVPGSKNTGKVRVVRNPEPSDQQEMRALTLERFGVLKKGEPYIRTTFDQEGNRYIWPAHLAGHGQVDPALSELVGGEVGQNVRPTTKFAATPKLTPKQRRRAKRKANRAKRKAGVTEEPPADAPRFAAAPREGTEGYRRMVSAMHPDLKNADGTAKVLYHGTKRPDRVGDVFRRSRATSGPMAFFTEDPAVASSYTTSKQDTSLEHPDDYAGWFKYKPAGSRSAVPIDRAWHFLSDEEKASVGKLFSRVTNRNEETGEDVPAYVLPEGEASVASQSHWDYVMEREAKGNPLRAMVEVWLNSAMLFNEEESFIDLLVAAGISRKRLKYDSPWLEFPAVMPTHLVISNPLKTSEISTDVVDSLRRAGRRKRGKQGPGTDPWDKSRISGPEWLDRLTGDIEAGTTHAWTSIPDWVTQRMDSVP